jgi:hypothetical protein
MISIRSVLIIAICLVCASACYAQLETGTILGTITDASGAVVPNAPITVQNQGTSISLNVTSDGYGNYVAPVLPIGTYRVTVAAAGFKTQVKENILLRQADRTRIDVTLEAGAVTERVTVTAEAPVVESATTALGGVVSSQQVSELPLNGRSLTSLIGLAPGVVMLGAATQRSMNGVSQDRLFESGSRFLVDGGDSGQVDSDVVDSAYASAARVTRASVDAVDEIVIQESSFSAEYGQAMGGVVNFVTKSGTNQFHGSLFEYFRNEKLDARNYFNVPPALKPPFRLNQFGGTIGGPILKNKLFFFANYEGVRQRLGVFQNVFVPTAAFRATLSPAVLAEVNQLPLPNGPASPSEPRLAQFIRGISNQLTEDTGSAKVDYQINSSDRLSVRYNKNESFTQTYYGVGAGQYRPVPANLQTAKVTYTKAISPTLLNEAGVALNRGVWYAGAAGNAALVSSPIVPSVAGMAALGPTLFDLPVANTSYTFSDTLTWIKGRHSVKAGFQIIRNQDNKAITHQSEALFTTLTNFANNVPFELVTLGQPRMGMRNTYNDFFVQDDIQASKHLTINAGLRYQYDTTPTESHGRLANFNPATGQLFPLGTPLFDAPKGDFGPRVGFAYTPFSSKKTVIRAGYGLFYSSFVAAAAQSNPSDIPGISQSTAVVPPAANPIAAFPFPALTPATSGYALYAFPFNWKESYTESWDFNIQQGLGANSVLQVGYVGNRGLHLSPFNELNRVNPATGLRKYPQFATITNYFDGENSNYNALQVSFRRRLTRGLTFNVNYIWSHALDESGSAAVGSVPQNDANFRGEYGNADYDVRNSLQFDYTYQLPTAPLIPKVIGSGWQVNGLTVMRAGFPYNVTCGCDPTGIGTASGRPDLLPGVPVVPANFNLPTNQLNIGAFATPVGHFGNLGRNVFVGPSAYNWDFSLFKNFVVFEKQKLQFRAEMFNLFNTPQFSNPGASIAAPATFGKTLSTIPAVGGFGSNRQIQFALRYGF